MNSEELIHGSSDMRVLICEEFIQEWKDVIHVENIRGLIQKFPD
jgi:hypothetical protein